MKRIMIIIVIILAGAAVALNLCGRKLLSKQISRRNITVNRINDEITELMRMESSNAESVISNKKDSWRTEYGKDCPDDISYIPVMRNSDDVFYAPVDKNTAMCALYSKDGDITGFVRYSYNDETIGRIIFLGNIMILLSFSVILIFALYIWFAVILPFRRLSEYPERLARLRDIQKLPESRSRYFGRYVWGMNMLSDVLASSSKRINELEGQRQKLVSSIAHGVKTPISNIRLYTDAVRTGLYSDDHEMTLEIADKIDSNTRKIDALAAELLTSSSISAVEGDIDISRFSVKELAELVRSEYTDRMNMKRIPFTVECSTEAVMESDKYALYRAISQILENAVKYGDGMGIRVSFMKQDDGFSISVRNRGKLLPENELPYIFRSYWRGSNAADKEGSGIGMYVVNETAKALGGRAYARRLEESSEMEFVIYIEN